MRGTPSPGPDDRAVAHPRPLARFPKRATLVLVVLVVSAAAAHRPLLVGYARLFRVHNPAPSDALVVLAGGSGRDARMAADLYRQGVAGTVLLMRKPLTPFADLNPAEVDRLVLVRNGVPPEAIRMLPPVGASESVYAEAEQMREYALCHPLRRITVVTKSVQTARARWSFRRALAGTGVDVRAAAAPDPGVDETNWYKTDEGLVSYFREALLTTFYRLAH